MPYSKNFPHCFTCWLSDGEKSMLNELTNRTGIPRTRFTRRAITLMHEFFSQSPAAAHEYLLKNEIPNNNKAPVDDVRIG